MEAFWRFANAVRQPLILVSAKGRILAASPSATALCSGLVEGASLADALADADELPASLQGWLRQGSPVPARLALRSGDAVADRRADVARVELGDGPAVLIQFARDDSPFAQLNDRLQRLRREVDYRRVAERERAAALGAQQEANRRLQELQSLTAGLAAALSTAEVVAAIQWCAAQAVGVDAVVVAQSADELRSNYPLAGDDVGMRDSRPFLLESLPLGIQTEASDMGALGLLCDTDRTLTDEERTAAAIVASLCGQALERARLYDMEHRFAETLQLALLPEELPSIDGLSVAVRYMPASEQMAVGGDWYDVMALEPYGVGLIVGDVAGHGAGAATVMAQVRNALRGLATTIVDPAGTLTALNAFMCAQLPEQMATVVYLLIDQEAGAIRYSSAGHPPSLLVDPGGSSMYLSGALGPPVGVSPEQRYPSDTATFDASASILAYSDGLVERRRESIDLGLRRLEKAGALAAQDADALCAQVVERLVGDEELNDDAVILVASVERIAANASPTQETQTIHGLPSASGADGDPLDPAVDANAPTGIQVRRLA